VFCKPRNTTQKGGEPTHQGAPSQNGGPEGEERGGVKGGARGHAGVRGKKAGLFEDPGGGERAKGKGEGFDRVTKVEKDSSGTRRPFVKGGKGEG